MRKQLFFLTFILLAMISNATNPLFNEFNTPHNTPPFNLINQNHYEEAIKRDLNLHKKRLTQSCLILKNRHSITL